MYNKDLLSQFQNACANGDLENAMFIWDEALIIRNYSINLFEENNFMIEYALRSKNINLIKWIINQMTIFFKKENLISIIDICFTYACSIIGSIEMCKFWVNYANDNKLNINLIQDDNDIDILIDITKNGYYDVLKYLLELNYNNNKFNLNLEQINIYIIEHKTVETNKISVLLYEACKKNYYDIVKMLIESNYFKNIIISDIIYNKIILMENIEILDLLIKNFTYLVNQNYDKIFLEICQNNKIQAAKWIICNKLIKLTSSYLSLVDQYSDLVLYELILNNLDITNELITNIKIYLQEHLMYINPYYKLETINSVYEKILNFLIKKEKISELTETINIIVNYNIDHYYDISLTIIKQYYNLIKPSYDINYYLSKLMNFFENLKIKTRIDDNDIFYTFSWILKECGKISHVNACFLIDKIRNITKQSIDYIGLIQTYCDEPVLIKDYIKLKEQSEENVEEDDSQNSDLSTISNDDIYDSIYNEVETFDNSNINTPTTYYNY